MPKKTRRMKERAAIRRTAAQAAPTPEASAGTPEEPVVRMRPAFVAPRPATLETYDYTHIYGDLKRIAIFAGFFFAVLIVLSFVIK